MKKLLLSIITITAFGFVAKAQNVNIPDANFKAYLVGNTAINTNGDTEIQVSEATAFNGNINCSNLSIADLTGIEAFTALTNLNCSSNSLSTLNITQNTSLTFLDCNFNSLSTLNMTGVTTLIELYCVANQLTSIDVSLNTSLTKLQCNGNLLNSLNINNNTSLTLLYCQNNSISSLNVSNNLLLSDLRCFSNSLSTLDVSNNSALNKLYCEHNSLTSLDVSSNNSLISLTCNNNLLTPLNVANGNNTNILLLKAHFNPNLSCVQVDDVNYSTTNWTTTAFLFDATASFSTNCSGCIVNIPDANFKAYLVGNTAINTNGDTEIQCSEASAFSGTMICSSLSIADLTGIEAFTALTQLDCNSNNLTSLNINSNTALTHLFCSYGNQLTTLDVSNNTNLNQLYCVGNLLTNIDVSNNLSLTRLFIDYNSISSLDVSNNTSLTQLSISNNQLTSLDISANTSLTYLQCQDNQLTSLNAANGNNSNINTNSFFSINNPNLTCIQVDNVSYSTTNWTNIDAIASFSTNCSGGTSVGIEEKISKTLTIYPNPATTELTISNVYSAISNISILDITGKVVKTINQNIKTINISDLTNGIYFLQVKTKRELVTTKFIKK